MPWCRHLCCEFDRTGFWRPRGGEMFTSRGANWNMEQTFMKKRIAFTLITGVLAVTAASAWAAVTASKDLPDGAQFTVDGGTLRIQFWSPEIVRVTYAPGGRELPALKSLSVVARPAAVSIGRGGQTTTHSPW